MYVDADLHLHSRFSEAVSEEMTIDNMAAGAKLKGIQLVGSGDCLHPVWLAELKQLPEVAKGTREHDNGVRFLFSGEVEDRNRVHHMFLLPSADVCDDLRARFAPFSTDIDTNGRPTVRLTGEAIANLVADAGGLIGPSHAFTPWTSIYRYFRTIRECYRGATSKVSFIELGLSANTYFADKLSELKDFVFLSNSDAHSPAPHRLGREFNRFEVEAATFEEIASAIGGKNGRRIVFNAGLDPRLGKYHCTSCIKCFTKYSPEESREYERKCVKCGSLIREGVKDRIARLANQPSTSPPQRPPYINLFPLTQIIQQALKAPSVMSEPVQQLWKKVVDEFGNENKVLIDTKPAELESVSPELATAMRRIQEGQVVIIPGGGGKYGYFLIARDKEELKRIVIERSSEINCVSGVSQKTLGKFF